MNQKVTCLIPAHNEAAGIRDTLESLIDQTHKPSSIVVASDNSTDETVAICKQVAVEYRWTGIKFIVFETVNNKAKKSGALNQALQHMDSDADYILQMDADTILDGRLIEEAIRELETDPELGGVCSRFTAREHQPGSESWWVWKLQHLEYSFYDSIRVESVGRGVKVLSGAVCVFRGEALAQIYKMREGKVWSETSIVEDYTLTLDLKSLGWKIAAGMGMFSITDTMPNLKSLWKQRYRWNLGTFLELKSRGWSQETSKDILSFGLFFFMVFAQVIFYLSLVYILTLDVPITIHPVGPAVLLLIIANRAYRTKYILRRRWYDVLIVLMLIPEELYAMFRNLNVVMTFVRSFTVKATKW